MGNRVMMSVVTIVAACFISACSSGAEEDKQHAVDVEVRKEGFPIVDEEITMTMMGPNAQGTEWKDMPFFQDYAEETNIHFEFNTPPASDFGTNLNLALSSGDLDDIIYGPIDLTSGMEGEYGEQGLFLPLEDLIEEYGPNMKKVLEERPDIKKSITSADGHIYALPHINTDHRGKWVNPVWYNGKWLDSLGVEELPESTDELYDLLIQFRDEDSNENGEADEIPISSEGMEPIRMLFLNAFGLKSQGIEEIDGEVRYAPITENYKEYLIYMNRLYEDNLLDPETFSQSEDQVNAKGQENKIGLLGGYYSYFLTGEANDEAVNNPMTVPLTSPVSDELIVTASQGFSRGAFILTEENPYPEASIRWADYFYTEEGGVYLDQGPEGYRWEWADEEKNKRNQLPLPEGYDNTEDYRKTLTPSYGIAAPFLNPPLEVKEEPDDFALFTIDETEEKREPYYQVAIPEVSIKREEQKEINTIEVDLESYVEQMEAKFITGVEPISNWDKYVETIKGMGIDRYVEIHQEAYDNWKSN